MIRQPPPLRFIGIVVGGWLGMRAAVLVPDLWVEEGAAATPQATPLAQAEPQGPPPPAARSLPSMPDAPVTQWHAAAGPARVRAAVLFAALPASDGRSAPALAPSLRTPELRPLTAQPAGAVFPIQQLVAPPTDSGPNRWSASAWLLARREAGSPLAPGGVLGGSQLGARLAYRLNGDRARPLAASLRVYAPLEQPGASEAAVGVDWRPLADVPVNLLVERRQKIGPEGHSAFSVTVYGGVSERPLPGGLALDAYAQAGVVGIGGRRAFVDGSASVTAPVGRLRAGVAAWGGAQPDAARLDVGPQVSVRLPVAGVNVRVAAEWRFRVAGESAPGSGPALSVGTDF